MKDKAFFDTNILVYMHTKNELEKQQISFDLMNTVDEVYISTQSLNEMANVLLKKYRRKLIEVKRVISELKAAFHVSIVGLTTINKALELMESSSFSYYDALIVASAIEVEAPVLYTEDMQNGQVIEGTLKIINPYAQTSKTTPQHT